METGRSAVVVAIRVGTCVKGAAFALVLEVAVVVASDRPSPLPCFVAAPSTAAPRKTARPVLEEDQLDGSAAIRRRGSRMRLGADQGVGRRARPCRNRAPRGLSDGPARPGASGPTAPPRR